MVKNYINGEKLINEILIPSLSFSKNIHIATGYFSINIFEYFKDEFSIFNNNGEKMKIIIGNDTQIKNISFFSVISKLSEEEIINYIEEEYFKGFVNLSDKTILTIYELLESNKLEIKIGYSTKHGIFHSKDYLFDDGNILRTIKGSLNFTTNALLNNYESVVVIDNDECYNETLEMFDAMWNNIEILSGTTKTIEEHLKDICITEIEKRNLIISNLKTNCNIKLRDYQEEAISGLLNSNFSGILEMATGTGKTFTMLYALKRFFEVHNENFLSVIVVPYKHLATQWVEEIKIVLGDNINILECHSDETWKGDLNSYIINAEYENIFLVMVRETFMSTLDDIKEINDNGNSILIVDEAHNLTKEILNKVSISNIFEYKIALSATPRHYKDNERTELLFSYFKGFHFKYNLKEAIENGHLTKYNYYPRLVDLNSDEENEYKMLTRKIKKETNNIKKQKLLEKRSFVLSNAKQKIELLKDDLSKIKDLTHTLIYCYSGNKSYDEEYDLSNIEQTAMEIKQVNKLLKIQKITYLENNNERHEIVNDFKNKDTDILLAIRCLDEGYNIPCIKRVFILYSTKNPKEFIQRRGRILRKYRDKNISYIHDYIVVVDGEIPYEEKIRYDEYIKLADNKNELTEFGIDLKWRDYE